MSTSTPLSTPPLGPCQAHAPGGGCAAAAAWTVWLDLSTDEPGHFGAVLSTCVCEEHLPDGIRELRAHPWAHLAAFLPQIRVGGWTPAGPLTLEVRCELEDERLEGSMHARRGCGDPAGPLTWHAWQVVRMHRMHEAKHRGPSLAAAYASRMHGSSIGPCIAQPR